MNRKFLILITAGLVVTAGSAVAVVALQKANTWHFVPGSVTSGDSFKVVKGNTQKSLVLCDAIAPELEEPFGIESRNYLRSLLEKNPKLVIKPVDETSDKLYARVKIRKDSKDVDLARKLVESGMARTEETFDKEVAKKGRFAITYIPPSACQIYDHQKGSSLYVAENQARDSQEGMWKEEYWRKDIEERWREINKKRKEETTAQDIEAIKKKQLAILSLYKYERLEKERELFKRKCMATPGCMEKKVKEF